MRKSVITIRRLRGPDWIRAVVRRGTFAVHPSHSGYEGYTVTHVETGLAIPPTVIGEGLSEREADAIAKHLAARFGRAPVINEEQSETRWIFEALTAEALSNGR